VSSAAIRNGRDTVDYARWTTKESHMYTNSITTFSNDVIGISASFDDVTNTYTVASAGGVTGRTVTYPSSVVNDTARIPTTSSTRRNIYVRGHLLRHSETSPEVLRRTFARDFKHTVNDFSDYPQLNSDNNSSSARDQSKNSTTSHRRSPERTRKIFHHFKLLHDVFQVY